MYTSVSRYVFERSQNNICFEWATKKSRKKYESSGLNQVGVNFVSKQRV